MIIITVPCVKPSYTYLRHTTLSFFRPEMWGGYGVLLVIGLAYGQSKYCCYPDQWEANEGLISGTSDDKGNAAITTVRSLFFVYLPRRPLPSLPSLKGDTLMLRFLSGLMDGETSQSKELLFSHWYDCDPTLHG